MSPSASICIASVSEAAPIYPPSGITILPPVVINPPPVYVPLTSRLALISAKVALISTSSVALISKTVALGALINCEASLNCNAIVLLRRRPVSGICVRVTSSSSPKDMTAPSARNKSENSNELVPRLAPSDASGTNAVSAVNVAVRIPDVPLSIAPNPDVIDPVSSAPTLTRLGIAVISSSK